MAVDGPDETSKKPDHVPGDTASRQSNRTDSPCCPSCGSSRIRSRNRLLSLNVKAFLVLVPLFVLSFVLQSCLLGILWFAIELLLVFGLSLSVCIAAVGRHRCRDCGLRFLPDGATPADGGAMFPWLWYGLNMALFILLGFVAPVAMGIWPHPNGPTDMMTNTGLLFTTCFLVWASLVYQIVIHKWFGKQLHNTVAWAVLFIWPGIVFGGLFLHSATPAVRAAALVSRAKLAPLPDSVAGIRVYEWSSPFSGEEFLRFAAEPNDIEKFVKDSPALQGQEPERFSAERMRLPVTDDMEKDWAYQKAGHETYIPHPNLPDWYKQTITGPARRYMVQPERYQYPGHVLIDDEQHVVYVYLIFS